MEKVRFLIEIRYSKLKPVKISEILGIEKEDSKYTDIEKALLASIVQAISNYVRNYGNFENDVMKDLRLPDRAAFDDLGIVKGALFLSDNNKEKEKFKQILDIDYHIKTVSEGIKNE